MQLRIQACAVSNDSAPLIRMDVFDINIDLSWDLTDASMIYNYSPGAQAEITKHCLDSGGFMDRESNVLFILCD